MKIRIKKYSYRGSLIFVKYPWYREGKRSDGIWCRLIPGWGFWIDIYFYDGKTYLGAQSIRCHDNDLYFRHNETEWNLQRVSKH